MNPSGQTDPANTIDPLDKALKILSDPRNQDVILALEQKSPRAMNELGKDSESLKIDLYHRVLPRLDKEGYVNWSRDSDVVTKGPKFESIHSVIRVLRRNSEDLQGELTIRK